MISVQFFLILLFFKFDEALPNYASLACVIRFFVRIYRTSQRNCVVGWLEAS